MAQGPRLQFNDRERSVACVSRGDAILTYCALTGGVMFASEVAEGMALSLANHLPVTWRSATWLSIGFNIVPALVAGWALGYAVTTWISTVPPYRVRAAPLVITCAALVCYTVAGFVRSRGFGLLAPVVVWPAIALLGAILGDLMASVSRARAAARS
jgi:hypothetical protein